MYIKSFYTNAVQTVRKRLARLSFRTGIIVLSMCIPFYIASFAQMALPVSTSMKGILWIAFFGLAKATQYSGLTILGAEGIRRIRNHREKNKE